MGPAHLPDEPTIREAVAADAPAISDLVSELSRVFIVPEFGAEGRERLLASMRPEAIRANLAAGLDVLVACAGGELVGVVATRDDRHLFHLFVACAWHRRGLARRLWDRARERCVARAGTSRFTVHATSYAREAYLRLGFRPTGPAEEREGVISHPMELVLEG